MDLSSNVFKVIGGVGAASVTAIATGVGIDQNNQHQKALEKEKAHQKELAEKRDLEEKERQRVLAKERVIQTAVKNIKESGVGQKNWFGGGLYEFLEDQDIVFEVLKVDNSELKKDNFKIPRVSGLTIVVKALISENSNQLKTSELSRVKIEHLKALNGGTDWTWSCYIKLSPLGYVDNITSYELKEKEKFFNNSNEGFFDVLTKDLSRITGENLTKWKDIKKGFVKNCSNANRGKSQLDLNWTTFTLRTKNDNEDGLYFALLKEGEDENARKWFDESITLVNNFGEIQN